MVNGIFLTSLLGVIVFILFRFNFVYGRQNSVIRRQFKQPFFSITGVRADVSVIKGANSQTSFNWDCEFLIANDRCAVLLSKKLIFFRLYNKPLVFSLDEEQHSLACRATGFQVYQHMKNEGELRIYDQQSGKSFELVLKKVDPAVSGQLQQAFEKIPVINYVAAAAKKG